MELKEHKNCRVLIADDQPEIHNDFAELLELDLAESATDQLAAAFVADEGKVRLPKFELLHAANGIEALEIIREGKEANRPVAVAYMDIRMPPGIDGVTTARRAREIDRDIEIVLMTAYTDKSLSEIIQNMELLHKFLYIRKPFAREEVQQITLSLVEKWNVEQKLAEKRRQLAAGHQRLEAVLDSTGDAMAMYDGDDRLVFANERHRKLFGGEEGELKKASSDMLPERFGEKPEQPGQAQSRGTFFIRNEMNSGEEASAGQESRQRLFYRFTAPVRDDREEALGRLVVYRDVSSEIEIDRMKAEVLRLRTELETTYSFSGIVGGSPQMRQVYALMTQASESDITALITGESGTGKELVVRSLHFNSLRKAAPLVVINCVAIPETLIESELFGHEQGAFTGAAKRRIGAFERARGGTVFLDEIGDMQLSLQARLLRVLQEREIQRVGGTDSIPVDVRVIAATNKNLEAAVEAGIFRKDLFYRIAAFPIAIPPLRERREDIPLLAKHFLKKHAERLDKTIGGVSTAALRVLLQYDWPGNVRELENAIERAVLLETEDALQAQNLPALQLPRITDARRDPPIAPAVLPLAELERRAVVHAMEVSANNVTEAARALGLNRATLYRKLKKYDVTVGN